MHAHVRTHAHAHTHTHTHIHTTVGAVCWAVAGGMSYLSAQFGLYSQISSAAANDNGIICDNAFLFYI